MSDSHVSDSPSSSANASGSPLNLLNNDVIQYKKVVGLRVNSELIYTINEKQLYVRNRKSRDGTFAYSCKEKSCKSRVYLKVDGILFRMQTFVPLAHGTKEDEVKKMCVMNDLKTKCAALPTKYARKKNGTTRDIFVDVLSQ